MELNDMLRTASIHIMEMAMRSKIKDRNFNEDIGTVRQDISDAIGARNYDIKARRIEDAKRDLEKIKVVYDIDPDNESRIDRALSDLDVAYMQVAVKTKMQRAHRKKSQKAVVRKVSIEGMVNRAKKSING